MSDLTQGQNIQALIEPETAEEALVWECPICGPIQPLKLPSGRFIRRSCACERKVRIAAREQEEREARRKILAKRTYHGWLGDGWADHGMSVLASKTFDDYDPNRKAEYDRLRQMYARETSTERKHAIAERIRFFEEGRKTWQDGIARARAFAINPYGSLILYGEDCGVGKTTLLAMICNALRERDISSLFAAVPRLFMAYYDRANQTHDEWELIRLAIQTPFLVLDDIDKEDPKDFRKKVIWTIIDARVTAGLPTAISTNDMAGLANIIGGPTYSRLMVGCVAVRMVGPDYRRNLIAR